MHTVYLTSWLKGKFKSQIMIFCNCLCYWTKTIKSLCMLSFTENKNWNILISYWIEGFLYRMKYHRYFYYAPTLLNNWKNLSVWNTYSYIFYQIDHIILSQVLTNYLSLLKRQPMLYQPNVRLALACKIEIIFFYSNLLLG